MRFTMFVTPTATALGLFACVVGCNRDPVSAPATDPAPGERTSFFSQLAAEPGSGALKARLLPKFPDLDLHVGRAGPAFIRHEADQPWTAQVEVQLVVQNGTKFEEARAGLLAELEEYLKAVAASTGTEIVGPFHEDMKDGKKVGFRFEYKTPENNGRVTVGPEDKVVDSFLIVVSEWK